VLYRTYARCLPLIVAMMMIAALICSL